MKHIIIKPVVTEKAMATKSKYVFLVTRTATKKEIADALEKMYKVEVAEVRTLVRKGKVKAAGRKRIMKTQPLTKKAYVTLKKGEIADVTAA